MDLNALSKIKTLNNGKQKCITDIYRDEKYYYIHLPFGANIIKDEEIKSMQGYKWMGFEASKLKRWRVDACYRNDWTLNFLSGQNPYNQYKLTPDHQDYTDKIIRPLYLHQKETVNHFLNYRQCIAAEEMGLGKTLSAFQAIEFLGADKYGDIVVVSTKSAMVSVRADAIKWGYKVPTIWLTYEELKKALIDGTLAKVPKFVVYDEFSKAKTPTSQRTQACMFLADQMRKDSARPDGLGFDCFIIGMTGTPAPKSPIDWWSLCEIVQPGYLKEPTANRLQQRLAIMKPVEDLTGAKYFKLVAWKDGNKDSCNTCGKAIDDYDHNLNNIEFDPTIHQFIPMENEVEKLYGRFGNLVLVRTKKECLDLPDKVYREIIIPSNPATKRLANFILNTARSTIDALIRLRELSDGFQYDEKMTGDESCKVCFGKKTVTMQLANEAGVFEEEDCVTCSGVGRTKTFERTIRDMEASPKMETMIDLLEDEFAEETRIVIYAGFTASIDKITTKLLAADWNVIRVDGRGWTSFNKEGLSLGKDSLSLLSLFQSKDTQKIAFVGHPGSAGMGLTLTASKAIIYYSNDYNAESRIQSEDRIHRIGMDENRGAMIIDLLFLESDRQVLSNLKRKRDLQAISLGQLKQEFNDQR